MNTCKDCERDTIDNDEYCSRCLVLWLDEQNLASEQYYDNLGD